VSSKPGAGHANGYVNGPLRDRIDEAAADGTITAARSRRAHEDIRVLGNDVLHEDWRERLLKTNLFRLIITRSAFWKIFTMTDQPSKPC
jgi:hypothetical protein